MEYTLALELKEAGFPQTGKIGDWFYVNQELEVICAGHGYECECPLTTYDIKNPYKREIVKAPKLEELIEACGDKFFNLNRVYGENGWECNVEHFDHDSGYPEATGKTPEEAVARLWLELNKK